MVTVTVSGDGIMSDVYFFLYIFLCLFKSSNVYIIINDDVIIKGIVEYIL